MTYPSKRNPTLGQAKLSGLSAHTRLKFITAFITGLTFLLHSSFAQAPVISSFSPAKGAAGETITINGSNFTGSSAVSFGGTAAASFTVVSSTKITAVIALGTSGTISVTNPSGTGTRSGFTYHPLNRIFTDFGGYWSSTLLSPNSIKPDSSHNLLGFRYNGIVYSTGANDGILSTNGISYTSGSFRSLPVASISGNNPGGSVYLALAKKVDGSPGVANASAVSSMTLSTVLTDGVRGLDMGTGFTNLPSSADITFRVFSIDTAKISDAEPDIILTQIAEPVSGNDIFSLTDSAGTLIGNVVTQNMTLLDKFGSWDLDLFNLTPNAPFNSATAYSAASSNTNREMRLVAFKLSDFGINSTNYNQVKLLKIAPSTNSDYAFIAYNTSSINLPPNISQNTGMSNTTLCSGGTAGMEVIATAASGYGLSFVWERSTNGGASWSVVTNGGAFSGATTKRLTVASPTNGDQYRATVTEAVSTLSSTSAVFTITISSPTAPTAVTITGGATVCRYNSLQLRSTVTGGSNLNYQWQSSSNSSGPYTNISGAVLARYEPPVSTTGTMYYRVNVSSGSGCSGSVTSASQTVTVTGISGVSGNYVCSSGTIALSATATSGTIDWYTDDAGGTSLYTGNNYTTPTISVTTNYYVAASGCASDIRERVTATVYTSGQWIGGSSGDWNTAANWCGGVPTSSTSVKIPAGSVINVQSANASASSITIASGGGLVMTGAYNLTISAGGTFTNNGSFTATGSTGTVSFAGNGTISGTTTFNNIDANGALNFGTASTVSGTFRIQPGGSVTGNSPFYSCPSSVLLYRPGSIFTRGLEWTNGSSGAGYPSNVTVQNNTTINFPSVGDGYICNDLQIDAGSSLRQDYSGGSSALRVGRNVTISGTLSLGNNTGGNIFVGGNWTRNTGGVFNANDRVVTFDGPSNFSGNGTAMSTIAAPASSAKDNEGGFGGEKFAHIWINKTNTTDSVVLLSNITVTRELGFTRGTFSLRNSDVTIVSNASRTADIAPVTNTANINVRYAGTGKFAIQRFVQNPTNTRSWRLLAAPLQSATAPTINEAWQEGVVNPDKNNPNASGGVYNPWPGFGTHITGPGGTYSATNGFDQGTNSASVVYINTDSAKWYAPANTITTKITDQQGWMLFVRGDRSFAIGNQYVPAQNTTLEPKGRINIGNITVPVVPGTQVVANPYASAISLMNVDMAGITGSNSTYYMWDPKMFTSYTQPGKWVTFTGVGTGFVQTTSESPYTTDGNIESGQAFMVDIANVGNVVFHESDKKPLSSSLVGIANAIGARPAGSRYSMLRSDIYASNAGVYTVTDGVVNIFSNEYNNMVNAEDAKKMISINTKESLSILRNDSVKIAIEKREDIQSGDTIYFSMSKFNELPYRFRFEANDFEPGVEAYLEDSYTGSRSPVNTSGVTDFDFVINADPASKAEKRFKVVFRNSFTVLPVKFTNVAAWKQNKSIAVQWKVAGEENIDHYEVEKSVNGKDFVKVNTTVAIQAGAYDWQDTDAVAGDNYYRIVSKTVNNNSQYSQVVKVNMASKGVAIAVYPNPVTDGVLNLQLSNVTAGKYNFELFDNTGRKVAAQMIICENGTIIKPIALDNSIAKGLYYALITSGTYTKKVKVIIE